MAGQDRKSQLDKFKEAARDLECDDDDERFKGQLGRIAKAKPKPANGAARTDD